MSLPVDTSGQIRVLHVDDDKNQLDAVVEFVKFLDPMIHIDSVSSPIEALKIIEKGKYDCIVTDFKMPEKNGLELSSEIRAHSNIPIIIYTGQGSEEVAEKAFTIGINDYIKKEMDPSHYQLLTKRIRDIVEKRRIEQIYASVVSGAKDAIVIVVGDKIVFINAAFLKLVGASSEKNVLYNSIYNLLSGIEKRTLQEEMSSLLHGEATYIINEREIKRKDRKKIPVEIKTSVIDYMGERALLYFLRDISERKTLEDEIKRSEIKYRSLVELAPDGVITISLKGDVTWINEAYTAITGFTADEIVGKKIWSIKAVKPTDIGMFLGLFVKLLRGVKVPPVEFQWISKDSSLGWGEGRASLIKIDGKKTEVLLSLRDITDRKQLETDLKKYSKDMERIADERAKKLMESEKMVVAGAIASTVAHDLKGPLNTILNAVYLMDMRPEKATQMKEIIVKAVGNASKMLEEARNKTSSRVLTIEEVEIASFIETIIEETPISNRIEVKTNLDHMTVEIDKLRMRRAIENLIRNAVDAMPSSGSLFISSKKEEEKCVIEVKDTGVGIPNEMLGKLFTPFQTTKESGTGLGLHYCKKTLEEHGGSIEVKSKVGSGTTFILRIPIKRKLIVQNSTIPVDRS